LGEGEGKDGESREDLLLGSELDHHLNHQSRTGIILSKKNNEKGFKGGFESLSL